MLNVSDYLDDDIFAQLRQDFLADARERLDAMESALGGAGGAARDALMTVRREAHSLKGLAGSLGFPSVTIVAHRLEDFVVELTGLNKTQAREVLVFVDCLRDIVEAGCDPGDEKVNALLRRLPVHTVRAVPTASFDVNKARRVEVLLVAPGRAVRAMITAELRSLGFRVSNAHSPWQALEIAARTKPDLIITSAVMDQLTGIDLARALRAISPTASLPLALLTSLDADHPDMKRLPKDVAIVHLNKTVTEDLGDLVTRFDLA